MEVNQRAPATSFLARAKAPSARHPAPVATEHAFTNPKSRIPNPRYLYFADSMWTLRADA